jgi:Glyoxalase/Bleomycin resistance protein/Dioxygenase superfamily
MGVRGGGRLEILEPFGDDGFLHRFLAARGPGIHHVTFRVPHLNEACERAVAHGFRIVGHDDSDPAWAEAFLHPKEALGIVVQLVESRATPDTPRPPFRAPAGPPDPSPSVTVLGLRLSAHSAERADTLRARVLGGRRAAGDGIRLVYRWPGSPMRLAVYVDADADEGPTAVEVECAWPLSLPPTPYPLLGTSFRRVTA